LTNGQIVLSKKALGLQGESGEGQDALCQGSDGIQETAFDKEAEM